MFVVALAFIARADVARVDVEVKRKNPALKTDLIECIDFLLQTYTKEEIFEVVAANRHFEVVAVNKQAVPAVK